MIKRSSLWADRAAIAVFALMAIGAYVRLYFSVGLMGAMDEHYWVAVSLQSSIGGTPFITDSHIQPVCGLLYEPITALYYKLFGNFGLILFIRHIFFLLAASGSAIFFFAYRDRCPLPVALAISAIPLVATMWANPAPGYNAIGGIGFACGAIIALRGFEKNRLQEWAVSGFFFFLSAGAYPTLIALVVFFWILVAAFNQIRGKSWIKPFLISNGVTATLLLIFVGQLASRSSIKALLFAYDFSIAHNSLGKPYVKFMIAARLFMGFIPPIELLIPFYLAWVILWWKRDVSWLLFSIPTGIYMMFKQPPEPGTFYPSMLLVFAMSAVPIFISELKTDFKNSWPEAILFMSSLFGCMLTGWSSLLTIYVTWVTSNYSLVSTLFLASKRKKSPALSLMALIIPLIAFHHKNIAGAIDDSNTTSGIVMMPHGPYAGLWTSVERQKFLLDLENDLVESTKESKSILFYDEFPLGYLMSDLRPATVALYMHGLRESYKARPYFKTYYSWPQNRPDIIVRFNYFVVDGKINSVHPDQYLPYQDVFWRYLPEESQEYTLVKVRDAYSIFRRIPVKP